MDEAASRGWNTSQKRQHFLIAAVTEGYGNNSNSDGGAIQVGTSSSRVLAICRRQKGYISYYLTVQVIVTSHHA